MGRVQDLAAAMDKYKSMGGSEFFKLEDDNDTAEVRMLYEAESDVLKDVLVVHEIEINGKRRWVSCLETGDCPACVAENRPQLRLFIQVNDSRDKKNKLWERGQKYIPTLQGLINKYGNLYLRPFEIERHGKKNDQQTTYQIYPLDKDDKTAADFPERVELLNGKEGFILELTAEEMELALDGKLKLSNPDKKDSKAKPRSGSSKRRGEAEVF